MRLPRERRLILLYSIQICIQARATGPAEAPKPWVGIWRGGASLGLRGRDSLRPTFESRDQLFERVRGDLGHLLERTVTSRRTPRPHPLVVHPDTGRGR